MQDPIDGLLAVASTPDWLTPLWATVQDVLRGPAYTFLVTGGGPVVVDVLKGAGCETWGAQLVGSVLMVSVPAEQAYQGWQALVEAGIPPDTPQPKRPARAAKRAAKGQRKGGQPRGARGWLAWLDELLSDW